MRCAAKFALHDDVRRARGIPIGDGPPPAKDRTSRKAAKGRMQALATVVNAPLVQRTEDTVPTQLGFVNVAEDVAWMRPAGDDTKKVRSSQPLPAAAGPPDAFAMYARLKQQRDKRQAVQ